MDDIEKIRLQMPVVAADGRALGVVSLVGNTAFTVTTVRDGHGFDHVIPFDWIAEVGDYVFLSKGKKFARRNWDAPSAINGPRSKAA